MHYAYILRSEKDPSKYYYGKTSDLEKRLISHNNGGSTHTAKYKPWKVVWCGCFESEQKASDFEKYLKSASGKAFLRKRLISVFSGAFLTDF